MKKTILITGGTGYIGSHGVVAFEQAGYKTVIVDNLCNSSLKSLDGIEKILGYKPDFYQIDLMDKNELEKVFKKYNFDGVLHFAGLKAVGESTEKPLDYFDNNVGGSMCLFELMNKYDVKKVIFSSSATVYTSPQPSPSQEREKKQNGINEGFITGDTTNPYGTTKFLLEQILLDLSKFSGFKVMNLRYFNPIGAHKSGYIGEDPEGLPNNLLPYVLKVANGELPEIKVFGDDYDTKDGTGIRDYIDVNDLIDGHLKAYEKMISPQSQPFPLQITPLNPPLQEGNNKDGFFEVYNLGTGKGISVLEIIKGVEKVVGKEIKYKIEGRREGDLGEVYCNANKALRELGWEATISLEDSLMSGWGFVNKE